VVSSVADLASLLERCRFPPAGTPVVCAVSGGPDSSALLVLAAAADLDVTAVHVDHGLRPGSEAEAEVVRVLAERFGAAFRSERAVVESGADLEARARVARLGVLGADAMTGHTADDQAETMLVNLLRGAGLDGLAGMTPGRRHPLLGLRRSETAEICERFDIEPVLDPMNTDRRFVRTRLRHELLPLIADISRRDPVPLLLRSADTARAAADVLDRLADEVDATSSVELLKVSDAVAATALRRWLTNEEGYPPSRSELDRVMSVVRGDVVGCQISGNRTIRRTAGTLRIEPTERSNRGPTTDVDR
jgi:tRNA(Ile)-lysidine synthase